MPDLPDCPEPLWLHSLSRHAQPAQEPHESLPWGSDFYQGKVSCDCREYPFRVKSIRLATAGVKWKRPVYPAFLLSSALLIFLPEVLSDGHPRCLPPPKTKHSQDLTLQAVCRQGVRQGKEMQQLHWIWHQNTLKALCFRLCILVCFKQHLAK